MESLILAGILDLVLVAGMFSDLGNCQLPYSPMTPKLKNGAAISTSDTGTPADKTPGLLPV